MTRKEALRERKQIMVVLRVLREGWFGFCSPLSTEGRLEAGRFLRLDQQPAACSWFRSSADRIAA